METLQNIMSTLDIPPTFTTAIRAAKQQHIHGAAGQWQTFSARSQNLLPCRMVEMITFLL